MIKGNKMALLIAKELWIKAREEKKDVFTEKEVIGVIKKIAGWDKRTINKYMEGLVEIGFIKQTGTAITLCRDEINTALSEVLNGFPNS